MSDHSSHHRRRPSQPTARPNSANAIMPSVDPLPASASSEIRRHYYLERYTIIAPKRNLRPDSFATTASSHTTETAKSPAIEKDPSVLEIKNDQGQWIVKVVENAFPAVSLDNPKAYGKQEVIIETPEHNVEFSSLPLEHIESVFKAYVDRVASIYKISGIRYVSVFKNDGPKAGASIAHAHSQLIAMPIVPPLVQEEATAMNDYFSQHGTCPHCDVIAWEKQQKVRVIFEDEQILAISPYAATYPYAVWLMPKSHTRTFGSMTSAQLHSFAIIIKKITQLLDKAKLSFNFFLHDSLPEYDHHFYIKIEPRVTMWAGFELSTGMVINPVTPEYAAEWYRAQPN